MEQYLAKALMNVPFLNCWKQIKMVFKTARSRLETKALHYFVAVVAYGTLPSQKVFKCASSFYYFFEE